MLILAIITCFVYHHRKREGNEGVPQPKEDRPVWAKPELPGEGLLELEATEIMPAELETLERSQELSGMGEHSG